MPVRVQLKRVKDWRMPENTVSVARPGKFGNPFKASDAIESGFVKSLNDPTLNRFLVDCFREWLGDGHHGCDWWQGPKSDAAKSAILIGITNLRGKNLACFCKLSDPCHADVLLELANT